MFGEFFFSWWFLLYALTFYFRAWGGLFSMSGEGLIYSLSNFATKGCLFMVILAFWHIPWWAALCMYPIGWILGYLLTIVTTPIVRPLAEDEGFAMFGAILSVLSAIGSLILLIYQF